MSEPVTGKPNPTEPEEVNSSDALSPLLDDLRSPIENETSPEQPHKPQVRLVNN